jgi:hypothetical protein
MRKEHAYTLHNEKFFHDTRKQVGDAIHVAFELREINIQNAEEYDIAYQATISACLRAAAAIGAKIHQPRDHWFEKFRVLWDEAVKVSAARDGRRS